MCQYVFGYAIVKLSDIAQYSKERVSVKGLTVNTYVGVDNLLQNKAGKKLSEHIPTDGNAVGFAMGDILIGNIRPYLKKIWYADCKGGTNGDVLVIRGISQGIIYSQYLYHVLASDEFFNYDNNNSKGAKMPRGNKDVIMQYKFAIPTIKRQKEIVTLLDRFDALCYDISTGLPAEIAARQKQYEYYRDRLLSFKEL